MRNRILLINPKVASRRGMRWPLSLLSLAAVLEGKYEYDLLDGNVDYSAPQTALRYLHEHTVSAIGITVMPGPQVVTAIEISRTIRAAHPSIPIIWGGYFPTLYSDAALNADYVDYLVRGQGEETLLELLAVLTAGQSDEGTLRHINGISFKTSAGPVHNPERHFHAPTDYPDLPYERLSNPREYLRPSFMGRKTGAHQAAIGCRYRCTFCGVVSMFNGTTKFSLPARLAATLTHLRDHYGMDALMYFDNNFFDLESNSVPMLEAMSQVPLPYWCFARADALSKYSLSTWELIRKSGLRMAYLGAESSNHEMLKQMRTGTTVEQTFEVAHRCREFGVIPEFSFILGSPDAPEDDIENTFAFIKKLKQIHPECEVILYNYSITPQRDPTWVKADEARSWRPILQKYGELDLPSTPEEWTEPGWMNYVCHQDAPWLSEKTRQRIKDFSRVLYCRFPTVQDVRTPAWGKAILQNMARWRYRSNQYSRPWELDLAKRLIPLHEPQKEGV